MKLLYLTFICISLGCSVLAENACMVEDGKMCRSSYANLYNNDTDADGDFQSVQVRVAKKFNRASCVSDSPPCAAVCAKILDKGGSVAEGMIAMLICMGATHPHTSGIGGGFLAMHYDATAKKSTVISAREKAPLKATEGMFDGKPENAPKEGGLAIAIPGEVKGYLELFKRFKSGKVTWSELFEPSIKLLENGYKVSPHMAQALINNNTRDRIMAEPNLKSVFVNPKTGNVWLENDTVREPVLASTLKTLAKNGEDFYNPSSSLNKAMMKELKSRDALATTEDFSSYRVSVYEPLKSKFDSYTLHAPGAPASGALLIFLFRCMGNYKKSFKADDKQTMYLYVECLKHTYGRRKNLGDPDDTKNKANIQNFEKTITTDDDYLKGVISKIDPSRTNPNIKNYVDETFSKMDSGTAHAVVVGPNGDAISATTTINTYLGSSVRSKETGVIFNDQMSDFVNDPKERKNSPANAIKGGKRPATSASPVMFIDSAGRVRLNIGGAGGVRILSAVSLVTMNHLWFNKNIGDAIESRRFHHILDPEEVQVEIEKKGDSADSKWVKDMKSYGHKVQGWTQRTVVVGIARDNDGSLSSSFDPRKKGSVEGF